MGLLVENDGGTKKREMTQTGSEMTNMECLPISLPDTTADCLPFRSQALKGLRDRLGCYNIYGLGKEKANKGSGQKKGTHDHRLEGRQLLWLGAILGTALSNPRLSCPCTYLVRHLVHWFQPLLVHYHITPSHFTKSQSNH